MLSSSVFTLSPLLPVCPSPWPCGGLYIKTNRFLWTFLMWKNILKLSSICLGIAPNCTRETLSIHPVIFSSTPSPLHSFIRSQMGIMEFGDLHLYPLCRNPPESWRPHIQSQICQPGPMDTGANSGLYTIPCSVLGFNLIDIVLILTSHLLTHSIPMLSCKGS